MGSELVSGFAGVRGVCVEGREEGVLRGAGDSGAIVAPSSLASSPNRVAAVSESTACPHKVQNLPFGESCAPQFEQNMGSGDSTIGSVRAANALHICYEMRSTWTAVP